MYGHDHVNVWSDDEDDVDDDDKEDGLLLLVDERAGESLERHRRDSVGSHINLTSTTATTNTTDEHTHRNGRTARKGSRSQRKCPRHCKGEKGASRS